MDILQYLDWALSWLWVLPDWFAVPAGVIVLGVAVYVIRSAGGVVLPVARSVKWLFGLPDDVIVGMAHGVRVLIWAVIVAAVLWFFWSQA
jgi:hypothetical protein